MRVGFVTCVELGLACIRAIYAAGGKLDFVITLPDTISRSKSGRVFLDSFCNERGISIFKTASINDPECVAFLKRNHADYLFVIGWSQIARPPVLETARMVIGAHPTLLPEGRGRAAIPWAILKGLSETGVTFFQLDSGVDSGRIVAQKRIQVDERETATSLYAKVASTHADIICELWPRLVSNEYTLTPQDESRATVWPARSPNDGALSPAMTVAEADRLVRATTRPYPGAFVRLKNSALLRIWAGRPALGEPAPGAQRIRFLDGEYEALEWEIEKIK